METGSETGAAAIFEAASIASLRLLRRVNLRAPVQESKLIALRSSLINFPVGAHQVSEFAIVFRGNDSIPMH